jgi:adenine-specific DNA glycosylase
MTLPLLAGSVVIERKGLFLVFKRPPSGLMADLWEFPTLHFARLPDAFQIREGLRLTFGLNAGDIQKLFTVHHSFTRYRATIRAFIAREPTGTPHVPKGWEKRWVTPEEILTLTFSAGSRKIRDRTMTLFPEDVEDIGASR